MPAFLPIYRFYHQVPGNGNREVGPNARPLNPGARGAKLMQFNLDASSMQVPGWSPSFSFKPVI